MGNEEAIKVSPNKYFKAVPTETKADNNTTKTWQFEMLPAIEEEEFSAGFLESSPYLMVAPNNFNMGETAGSNNSWNNIAAWAGKLCVGLDSLNQATIDTIKSIASKGETNFDKAKLLYEYMQQKVRYVSIQVGLGGWQPFSAETVDHLSYGDCKALSNYMKSLLEIAGVPAYYVLAKAGQDAGNINKDFICSQFNHAIVMVPFEKDTLFLECTSQLNPLDTMALLQTTEMSWLLRVLKEDT